MKNQRVYKVMFIGLLLLFAATLALGAESIVGGEYDVLAVLVGVSGCVAFAVMLFGGMIAGSNEVDEATQGELNHQHFCRLQDWAEANPGAIARKLRWLGTWGSLYISFLMIGILSIIAGIVVIAVSSDSPGTASGILGPFIAAMLGVAYVVLSSLRVPTPPIMANRIQRREYPYLFAAIDRAARALKVKAYQDVYLLEEPSCGVANIGGKEVLSIGIHLLELLDRDELSAVLIHEFAHVHHKDTKMSYKLEQSSQRWAKIGAVAAEKGFLAQCLLRNFAEYYVVQMQMHLAALRKQQEHLADWVAARHANAEVFATALGKLAVMAQFLRSGQDDEFELRDKPFPPADYYSILFAAFYTRFESKKEEWTGQILKMYSNKYDSHPAVKERLQHIGLFHIPPMHFDKYDSAYRDEINKLMDVANMEWYVRNVPLWDEFCSGYRESRTIVKEYTATNDIDTNIDYAMALENLSQDDEAMKIYESILSLGTRNPAAVYRKGLILLSRKDNSGIELVREAMEADNSFIDNGLYVLGEYLYANGLESRKEALMGWAQSMVEISEKKQDEFNTLYITDTFVPAQMDLNTMLTIKGILRSCKEVSRGYLVQKVLQYTEADYYVVAVTVKSTCSKKRMQRVFDRIAEKLNSVELSYFLLNMNISPSFRIPISRVQSSEIFKR